MCRRVDPDAALQALEVSPQGLNGFFRQLSNLLTAACGRNGDSDVVTRPTLYQSLPTASTCQACIIFISGVDIRLATHSETGCSKTQELKELKKLRQLGMLKRSSVRPSVPSASTLTDAFRLGGRE